MIKVCTCQHQAQDSIYGKGRRVMNITKKFQARCTVCLKEIPLSQEEQKKIKEYEKNDGKRK